MQTQAIQTPQPNAAIVAKAFVFKDDRLLILRKPERDRLDGSFPETAIDFPGGKLEPGETWQEGLAREVAEEVQLAIVIGSPFNAWSLEGKYRQILGVDFLAEWISGEVVLSEEHETYEWLTLEEIQATQDVLVPSIEQAFLLRNQLSKLQSI